MKITFQTWIIIGLAIVIALMILFDKDPNPNGEKIKSLEYAIAISDQQKKDLEDKHKADSTASAQKIAQLRDSLSKEQRHGVKLSRNLERLRANPIVIRVQDSIPEIKATFAVYDSLLESKDQQLKIQADMIEAQRIENVRITENFMERLKLSEDQFIAQSEISKSYKKQLRKERRGKTLFKVLAVTGTVAGLFLGGSL